MIFLSSLIIFLEGQTKDFLGGYFRLISYRFQLPLSLVAYFFVINFISFRKAYIFFLYISQDEITCFRIS